MKTIKDIMTPNPETVQTTSSLKDVATVMKRIDVGVVPVVEGKKVVGLITDRDIVLRSTAEGKDPTRATAGDIMSTDIDFVYSDQDVNQAAMIMSNKQIRRLPVVDREMQMVGIISLGDLSVDAKNEQRSGQAIEDISKPAHPDR